MNSPNQVLYLSYDGLTDPLGQSQILPYVIGLSKYEYEFTIISFEKPQAFAKLSRAVKHTCAENSIDWIPLPYHKWPPVLSTLYDIWRLWRLLKKKHRQKEIHIVHCRSYITSLVGVYARNKWGVKFVFDMRGFWADERVEGGLWNLKNPFYRKVYDFFKEKERQFLIQADHVVSLTHNAKKEIESWGITDSPITVIPTCVDLELFEPKKIKKEDQDQLRLKLGIKETDFVLLYLGSWGTWYLTKEMLHFFSTLKKEKPNAKFLIVSPDEIHLNESLDKNDVIVTKAPRHLIPLHISLANLAVLFIRTSFSKKASSATKMGEALAMGVPIVTNSGWGDVDLLINQGANIEIWREDFFKKPKNRQVRPDFVNQNLSLQSGVMKYKQIYDSLLPRDTKPN